MKLIIQEEELKNQTQLREIKAEIVQLNRKNQEIFKKLQNTEKEGKNKLMNRKNEHSRFKENLK